MTPSPEEIEEWLRRLTVESELAPQEAKEFVQYFRELQERVEALFDAIKHGDEKHQTWLREAIRAHFAGEPVVREASRLLTTKGER